MKPTMPMNAYPPGHFGTPPPGGHPPGGGGWGPPPGGGWGGPPGPPAPPAPAPPKSRKGLYVGGCCGCLMLLACGVGGWVFFEGPLDELFGPGEEMVSTPIVPGQPFSLSYTQRGSERYQAWLEVDVDYVAGYNLNGTILLNENGTAFGEYALTETGSGSAVTPARGATRFNFTATNPSGNGSAQGMVMIFPIPAKTEGATISLTGTIHANAGTTGPIRLFVARRTSIVE